MAGQGLLSSWRLHREELWGVGTPILPLTPVTHSLIQNKKSKDQKESAEHTTETAGAVQALCNVRSSASRIFLSIRMQVCK